MDDPITEQATIADPVKIEYFRAAQRPQRHGFRNMNLRAAIAIALALGCTVAGVAMGTGKTDPGPIMVLPVWALGAWYVVERSMSGRSSLKIRLAMAGCAGVAAVLSPFLVVRSASPSVITDLLRYGWGTQYVSTLERIVLGVVALAVIVFIGLRLSDPVSRREQKLARRLAYAQQRRIEQQNRLLTP